MTWWIQNQALRARALMKVPSGALIRTWQVIRRVLGTLDPAEVLEDTIGSVEAVRCGT